MSDTPVPDSRTAGLSGEALRGLAASWWLFLVGVYAVFYGFTELFAAFDLRGLGHRLDRQPPERPAA